MNVKTSSRKLVGEKGDMITIVEPWMSGVDYCGLITDIDEKYVYVWHCDLSKRLTWSRYVKCIIEKYNTQDGEKEKNNYTVRSEDEA
jgi:hypothetical protein